MVFKCTIFRSIVPGFSVLFSVGAHASCIITVSFFFFFGQVAGCASAAGSADVSSAGLVRGSEETGRAGPGAFRGPAGRARHMSLCLQLCFALGILGNPLVLLLDEPSTGMDPEGQQRMW